MKNMGAHRHMVTRPYSDIQSYDGDSASKDAKELHDFTKEEFQQFEAVYKIMANSLAEVYKGLTILEA